MSTSSDAEKRFSDIQSAESIKYNEKQLHYLRDLTSLVSGISVGVLGIESFQGFLVFLASFIIIGLLYIAWVCQFQPGNYYVSPIKSIFLDLFVRELSGFVMCWTFSYALVN